MRFQAYPAVAEVSFDCPSCGKPKRKRSFRVECTVNPFNRREDGEIRTPDEVRQQSRVEVERRREEFMRKPLCATCENNLSFAEQRRLNAERRGATQPAA